MIYKDPALQVVIIYYAYFTNFIFLRQIQLSPVPGNMNIIRLFLAKSSTFSFAFGIIL